MFTTLDDDAKFLFDKDTQRGATGFDEVVFIRQRLGIPNLRRRVGKQQRLYAHEVVGMYVVYMMSIP